MTLWLSPGVVHPDLAARLPGLVEELDDSEIGDVLGCSTRTVRRLRTAAGLSSHRAPTRDAEIRVRWTQAEVSQVVDAARAAGLGISEYVRGRVLVETSDPFSTLARRSD